MAEEKKIGEAFVEVKAKLEPLKQGLERAKKIVANFGKDGSTGIKGFASRSAAHLKGLSDKFTALGGTVRGVIGAFSGIIAVAAAVVTAIVAIGAAIVKLIAQWSEQQKITHELASALRATGQDVDTLLPKFNALANNLGGLSTLGDEVVTELGTIAVNLGLVGENAVEATRAAFGLSKVTGQSAKEAIKNLTKELSGESSELRELIPALKTAATQEERLAILRDKSSQGLKQLAEETDTIGGAYTQFKNKVGDVGQALGQFFAGSGGTLEGVFKFFTRMAAHIERVISVVVKLRDSALGKLVEKFLGITTGIKPAVVIIQALFSVLEKVFIVLDNLDRYTAAVKELASSFISFDYVKGVFESIAKGIQATFDYIGGIMDRFLGYFEGIARKVAELWDKYTGGMFEPFIKFFKSVANTTSKLFDEASQKLKTDVNLTSTAVAEKDKAKTTDVGSLLSAVALFDRLQSAAIKSEEIRQQAARDQYLKDTAENTRRSREALERLANRKPEFVT